MSIPRSPMDDLIAHVMTQELALIEAACRTAADVGCGVLVIRGARLPYRLREVAVSEFVPAGQLYEIRSDEEIPS